MAFSGADLFASWYGKGFSEPATTSASKNSVQVRKADVDQNQIRFQFFAYSDCFQSIRRLAYDLQFRPRFELGADVPCHGS
jgi:hypothetical protein